MAVDFSGPEVESIELTLEDARPGGWRRLDAGTLNQFSGMRAGWTLSVPDGQFAAASVDQLYVLIDTTFPASEPRILAPKLKLGDWPHVEPGGLVCLKQTSWAATAGDRVLQALDYAAVVLNFSEAERGTEFGREFAAYWRQFVSNSANPPPLFITLMPPHPANAEILFTRITRRNLVVLSDNEATLRRWLENAGEPASKRFRRTRLRWLPRAWLPSQFPRRVSDILGAFGAGELAGYLRTDESLPVLFGAPTPTGNVFVGVEIPWLPRKLFRGFRASATVPGTTLAAMSAGRDISRCRVERGDPAWVHGRDRDPEQGPCWRGNVSVSLAAALSGVHSRDFSRRWASATSS